MGIARGAAKKSALKVLGTLIKSGAGTSVIDLATTDTGLIEAVAGTLDFTQKLKGTGALKIDAGATLEADNAATATLTVSFTGAGATLALKKAAKFGATIAGFTAGETIDLLKTTATGASVNASDQLVIVNGVATVATLQLTGNYAGATFTVGSDGHGGTDIAVTGAPRRPPPAAAASPAPSPHPLITAMASLGATAASASVATAHVEAWRATLLAPRAQSA